MTRSRLSIEKISEMKKLKNEGKNYTEISRIIGCTDVGVKYHLDPTYKIQSKLRLAEYQKINPLRNKLRSFSHKGENITNISSEEFLLAFSNQNVCYLTGDKIDVKDTTTYELDHIVPVSKGGSNQIDNMGLCTKEANRSKQNLTIEEYIELCKKVLIHNGYKITKENNSID